MCARVLRSNLLLSQYIPSYANLCTAASKPAEPAFDPFGNAAAAAATATKPIDVAPVKEEFNSYNFWKPQHAVIDDDDDTKA